MAVKARMKISHIVDLGAAGKQVHMALVHSDDPASDTFAFSKAAQYAQVILHITDPATVEQFKVDAFWDVALTPTPLPPAASEGAAASSPQA